MKRMNRRTRMLLTAMMAVGFVFGMAMTLRQARDNAGGDDSYQSALEIAMGGSGEDSVQEDTQETTEPVVLSRAGWIPAPIEEEDPYMTEMEEIDLEALRQVNPDVVAWIRIPNTKIDYPILQGEDNEFYLKNTWEGYRNSVGSIFLEHLNSPNFTDFNTIIYGHNMNNGSMFGMLSKYRGDNWQDHPYVYLATDYGVLRYEVFAAYKAALDDPTYGLSFTQKQTRENFLNHALESSRIDTGIEPAITDQILTLSTCSGSNYSVRWVVQARLPMIKVTVISK